MKITPFQYTIVCALLEKERASTSDLCLILWNKERTRSLENILMVHVSRIRKHVKVNSQRHVGYWIPAEEKALLMERLKEVFN